MKKAANILLIISGVFAILSVVGCLIGGLVLLYFTGPESKQVIIDLIDSGKIDVSGIPGTSEEIATVLQHWFSIAGIACLIITATSIGCGVVAFMGAKVGSNGLYIANIILGILSCSLLAIIGGILGVAAED